MTGLGPIAVSVRIVAVTMDSFHIRVPEAVLTDLHRRLDRTRWPDEVEDAGWEQGTSLSYLRELVTYWRGGFDWRRQEADLNRWPQYRVRVDGRWIHFIRVRGRGPNPTPLLLSHGWPSSFYEMLPIVPLLAAAGFDVIVPSLPGFGFSEAARSAGASRQIPQLLLRLMNDVLGYPRFAAHGTDIGAFLTNRLALEYPDRLIGIHVTLTAEPHHGPGAAELSERERAFLADRQRRHEYDQAYAHIQRTRPQSLAYGLNDSPAGLAGWIVEKWRAWSDCGGDVDRRFSKDQLLTTVMIYWVTQTIAPSIRVYRDWALATASVPGVSDLYPQAPPGADGIPLRPGQRINVPTAIAAFLGTDPPLEWIARAYRHPHYTRMPRGGHFAAMEEPELLANHIADFFHSLPLFSGRE